MLQYDIMFSGRNRYTNLESDFMNENKTNIDWYIATYGKLPAKAYK